MLEINITRDKLEIAKLLKSHRLRRGLTQKELAKKAKVSDALISYFESGIKFPSLGTLLRLLAVLGLKLNIDYINIDDV